MIRLAFLVLPLTAQAGPPAPPACPVFAEPAPQMKLATVAGTPITRAEVDAKAGDAVCAQQMEHARKLHELRSQTLEGLISERLLKDAAKAAGNPDHKAWLAAELAKTLPPVGDAEVRAFYDQNQARMEGKSFEEVAPMIGQYLTQQLQVQAYGKLLDGLKAKASVSVLMAPFRMPVDDSGTALGAAKAPITVVEFADFECGYCARAQDTIKAVRAKYGDKIRFVYKDFPLEFHANARPAAIAARCAGKQGKYWEMHEKLFANTQNLNDGTYRQLAGELGLDAAAFGTCLADPAQAAAVAADEAAGRKVGVTGTPAFFINGILISGAQPIEAFSEIIDAELARKK